MIYTIIILRIKTDFGCKGTTFMLSMQHEALRNLTEKFITND